MVAAESRFAEDHSCIQITRFVGYPGPRGLLNNPQRGEIRAAKRLPARRVSAQRRKPLVASATFFTVKGVKSITRPITQHVARSNVTFVHGGGVSVGVTTEMSESTLSGWYKWERRPFAPITHAVLRGNELDMRNEWRKDSFKTCDIFTP